MKKVLSALFTLLVFLILLPNNIVTINAAPQPYEVIRNGGFEDGFKKWTLWSSISYYDIVSTDCISGSYALHVVGSEDFYQSIKPVPVSDILSATFWARSVDCPKRMGDGRNTGLWPLIILFYVDEYGSYSSDYFYIEFSSTWVKYDITSHLRTSDKLVGITLSGCGGVSTQGDTFYDDISIIATK